MFRNKEDADELEKYGERIDGIISIIQQAKNYQSNLLSLNELLQTTIIAAGGHLWQKDAEGRYLYCDPSWCEVFFNLEHNCDIRGFNDQELLEHYRSSGRTHTYGDVCNSTDDHCKNQKVTCHYIELGWIDDELFAIDVVKTPMYTADGTYNGTVGFARNLSKEISHTCHDLERSIYGGTADVLFKQGNKAAAYWVKRDDAACSKPSCLETFPG